MRLRTLIPAGLLDAGSASVATFAIGLYAARFFSPELLGAYALFFTAFLLAAVVPTQLLLIPSEVSSLALHRRDRLVVWRWMLIRGMTLAMVSAALASSAATMLSRGGSTAEVANLALTMVLAATLSPLQDHLRRLLHLSDRSWHASSVSVVQVVVIVGALALLTRFGAPRTAIPFGALAIANVASLSTAMVLARPHPDSPRTDRPTLKALLTSGRWLLVNGGVPAVATFLVAAAITTLAGAAALGFAEAARLVAQPLYVVATGLGMVLGPRSMEAAAGRSLGAANAIAGPFIGLMGMLGLGYLLITATPWVLNPMLHLVPKAYEVPWLVAVTVAATLVHGSLNPLRSELVGGRRERYVAAAEVSGSASSLVAVLSAQVIGAFARPASLAVYATVLAIGLLRGRRVLFTSSSN